MWSRQRTGTSGTSHAAIDHEIEENDPQATFIQKEDGMRSAVPTLVPGFLRLPQRKAETAAEPAPYRKPGFPVGRPTNQSGEIADDGGRSLPSRHCKRHRNERGETNDDLSAHPFSSPTQNQRAAFLFRPVNGVPRFSERHDASLRISL